MRKIVVLLFALLVTGCAHWEERSDLSEECAPLKITVNLTSVPSGAEIYYKDTLRGTTPFTLILDISATRWVPRRFLVKNGTLNDYEVLDAQYLDLYTDRITICKHGYASLERKLGVPKSFLQSHWNEAEIAYKTDWIAFLEKDEPSQLLEIRPPPEQ
jgi:hypothetical protein